MTLIAVLCFGLGAILMMSSVASNPDGSDLSVTQTVVNVWNNDINFTQGNTPPPKPAFSGPGSSNGVINPNIPIQTFGLSQSNMAAQQQSGGTFAV